ncbi:FeoA family protein [Pannus brasiliensis CCIBt3594]|uniref:FeoA family protein n=1 Tax=Pannus brasiliensis CCIBt3594 TaxID=1427578 RepID=A0AAW9QQY4_9CHRO
MTLSELLPGQTAIVPEILESRYGQGLANRLEAMGIISNKPVRYFGKRVSAAPYAFASV